MEFKLLANTPMGLERVVADEIESLGYETTLENGRVFFEGSEEAIIRTNLMMRTADRIRIIIGDFEVSTFDELFEKTKALPWSDILGPSAEFPVTGRSHKSTLYSVPDVQRIVKKAVVEHLKGEFNIKGKLPETGPRYKIDVSIHKDRALLTIDTSGPALHKRGYRTGQGEAPIKETLAAAMLKLANYDGSKPLIDPFAGSGTIVIEAAMIALNIAPGSNRTFDAEKWDIIPEEEWRKKRMALEEAALYDKEVEIYASDIEERMIQIARDNAMEVGLDDNIQFEVKDVHDLYIREDSVQMVTNPPYGERIGEAKAVEDMYRKVGKLMKGNPTLSVYLMTSSKEFEHLVGQKATKRRKLFNGYIETTFFQYWGKRAED
ncbi:THUMP domain-containing class I SAM-dependent RNA methyltransferase [Salinicoccus sp. HZC-1]|uniref:THUMP domain-containing class I SAM-dependent RNA methyltransferase n=1 Tax=Salinicoccus sp. HZC-1 TaxID=3385497 RepID=UPI00398B3A8E